MPDQHSGDAAFFSRAKTKFAINEIASSGDLSLLVGAGVSVEAGLPNWESLVDGLLIEVAGREGIEDGAQRKAFSDHIRVQYGNLTAASVAQASLGREGLIGAVRNTVYRGARFHAQPGLLAKHIAFLLAMHPSVTVATTNYDSLLELAVDGLRIDLKSIARTSPAPEPPDGMVQIVHLHGLLPPEGALEGDLILGERDYAEMQRTSSWQEDFVREKLARTKCLFVGSSLSDPNLIRYLYLSDPDTGTPKHWAIFVRQQDSVLLKMPTPVATRVNEHLERRLMEMGVRRIAADYYGQVAQFMFELVLRRVLGDRYDSESSYADRLRSWRATMDAAGFRRGDQRAFDTTQRRLHDRLREVREFVTELALLVSDEPEDFGVHLWVRNPHTRSLELWANSAYVLDDERAMLDVRITAPSPYQAIETFCSGTPSMRAYSKPGSRWLHSMGQPLYVRSPPWYHLPVGVITLASTKTDSESSLRKLPPAQTERLWRELRSAGAELITPSTPR